MYDIVHRIGVESPDPTHVYHALTTLDGLAGWWTRDVSGTPAPDGVIEFRFPPGGFDMKVVEQRPDEQVSWEVVGGPDEWLGTTVDWRLRQDGDHTIVMFTHAGWKEPVEFMHHCSTKWATFLMSLKSLVETGTGAPSPDDVHVAYPD